MKIFPPIILIFFISEGIAQIVTKTEEFDDGGLQSITYFKKIENKFVLFKEEQFYDDGSLWYSCELQRIFNKKDWKYKKIRHGKFLSFHSNGSKKEEGIYNQNKKDGKWINWYGNGYKKMEEIFKDGTLISKKTWKENGKLNY
tara:strand:- start:104 stop:532 length:429 start_codon:yes stop_codon:yes gene_type:complete